MKKRLLSILLTVCMVLSMLPVSAFATDGNAPIGTSSIQEGTLCEHHTQHDASCGFVMAQTTVEGTEEILCDMNCTDTDDDGEINHADGCAYAPATEGTPAVEGVPCGFVCEECTAADNIPVAMTYVQVVELFQALPKADSITAETSDEDKQAAYDKLGKAMAAFEELSEDEQKQFLIENEALYLAVVALNDAISGNKPQTLNLDTTYDIWVAGVQVTSANKDAIQGDGIRGTVTYDPDTSTLTLHDASIEGSYNNAAIYTNDPLNIVLEGSNIVSDSGNQDFSYGIWALGLALTIGGDGSLEVSGAASTAGNNGSSLGVYADTISINSGTIICNGGAAPGWASDSYGMYATSITINGGTVAANGGEASVNIGYSYGMNAPSITINGGTVTASSSNAANSRAFNTAPNLAGYTSPKTIVVGNDKDSAVAWDNSTGLNSYKYVKVAAPIPNVTVTFNGTTTGYDDFATAWSAAIGKTTTADAKAIIKLTDNVSATVSNTEQFINENDYLVLDTNGHTLDFGAFSYEGRIKNNGGSLEIIGSGKITGTSSNGTPFGLLRVTGGAVKVIDVTIENLGSSTAVLLDEGEFHFISGNLISGGEYALLQRNAYNLEDAKCYLYSGKIKSNGRFAMIINSGLAFFIMPSAEPLILINQGIAKIVENIAALNFSKVEITDLKYGANADGSNLTTKTDNAYDTTVNASKYVTITKRPIAYAITAPVASNGSYTVKVDDTPVTKAAEGATVTITPTADSGYELDSIKITKTSGGSDVTSTVNWNATAKTFTMPAYAVTVNVSFKKIPTASDFTFTAPASLVYSVSGKSAAVTAASSISGMGEITVEYYSGATKLSSAPTDIGNYTVKINVAAGDSYAAATGITDSSWAFTVTAKGYASSDFAISAITHQTYTGSEIEPALEVKLGDTTLLSGTDYTLSYSDNKNAGGSAKVAIEFKGNFSGKAEKTFTILPLDISTGATVGDFTAMTYSGESQTPSATVTKGTLTVTGTWSDVTNVADKTTFTASGNFTGTIADKATGMAALSISDFTLGDFASMTYSGKAQTPSASVTKEALTATGTWSNVTNVADKTTFTASGNFTGTIADKATGMKKAVVSDLNLSTLITAPSKNAVAQTTLVDQTQYTATISWLPALPASGKFLGEIAYTATLTLVPTENYTLTGVAQNSFTYTGASATNGMDCGTVSLVFAKTGTRMVESITITGTPTKTTYHFGEAFDATGFTITATYDDGSIADITSGYTVSPNTMQGDTTQITITYGDKTATVTGFTVKENLSSIATPAAILGVANGTAKSTSALNLPSTVSIVTSKDVNPTTTATVNWDMDSVTYDSSLLTEQSFTIYGTVALPTEITNVDNVSLCVTIAVTVNAANTVAKPALDTKTNPTDTSEKITGLTDNQKVSPNSTLTITADSFIRGDKTYIPVAWKTNPEGTFSVSVGNTYFATVNTSGMTTGAHTFTVIYREVETTTGTPTGNIVETAISYTLKSAGSGSTGGGSSTTYYTITAAASVGGNISTGKYVSVREGDSAGFTMIPDKGYIIADVKVDGKSVGTVKNYVFTNVRANHTIEVTFKASSGHVNPQTGIAFEDVSEDGWFYDSVYNAVNNSWFAGTFNTTFAPYLSTTRGMIATML
ncbi:MAG: bacterial Ig-like domain-containing protein [Angelakisella sp.]|nr:bacterial Ig-like domain-containing protein [Angelakisella sp.]